MLEVDNERVNHLNPTPYSYAPYGTSTIYFFAGWLANGIAHLRVWRTTTDCFRATASAMTNKPFRPLIAEKGTPAQHHDPFKQEQIHGVFDAQMKQQRHGQRRASASRKPDEQGHEKFNRNHRPRHELDRRQPLQKKTWQWKTSESIVKS